jgi:pimeloyl-ACP methyl ester carboxylesterase
MRPIGGPRINDSFLDLEGPVMKFAQAGVVQIAYDEVGPADGWPVVLSHGFPYDISAYEAAAPLLAAAGARVFMPYLRGFGPTRFRYAETMRSGQQAALASDLIELPDSIGIERAILAGYDWGGPASCVAAALWPERVAGLVSLASEIIAKSSWAPIHNSRSESEPSGIHHSLLFPAQSDRHGRRPAGFGGRVAGRHAPSCRSFSCLIKPAIADARDVSPVGATEGIT